MGFFTTNIERLRNKQPALAQQIADVPLHNVRLMRNEGGEMIGQSWDVASQQWISLCDPANPWREAEADAAALWTKDARVFCCFGLGLGYFPTALAKRLLPYQRMAIFDPNPMHYVAMLHAIDAEHLQGERQIETFIGDNLVAVCEQWWLGLQSHEKLHIAMPMRSGFTNLCNVDTYNALLEKTGEMLRYHAVGLATWKQFGAHIGYSDWGNLPEYFLTPGMQELKGLWEGKPAVCVAAGPSLRKNIALLRNPEYRNKVAVITVGTTYALLQSLGIVPDIVTTIDFQRLNWTDQFLHVPLDNAPPLVYLHSTHPGTVRRWPGPRFVGLNASDTTAWMAQFAEPKASAGQVQSVAHLNLVVAQLLGANPIILIGQDLSMTPQEHHALGARAQDTAPQESYESHIEMPGYDGQPVWSRHSLLSMKLVFEQLIAQTPDRAVLNCTEGGLSIVGAQNGQLEQVLSAIPGKEPVLLRDIIEKQAARYSPTVQWDAVSQGIGDVVRGLDRLAETARTVLHDIAIWETMPDGEERVAQFAKVKSADEVFQQEGLAFGQIAIRRFEIIELISAIPPLPDTPEPELVALNVTRLRTVATVIAEDAPVVRHLIRQAQKRLTDVCDVLHEKPITTEMFARQSYPALSLAAAKGLLTNGADIAALAWSQQRYYGLQSLAPLTPAASRYAARTAKLLRRHDDRQQELGWHYLTPRKE